MKTKKTRDLHLRLDDELYEAIFTYCIANGLTVSKFIRLLLVGFLMKEGTYAD